MDDIDVITLSIILSYHKIMGVKKPSKSCSVLYFDVVIENRIYYWAWYIYSNMRSSKYSL